MDPHVTCKNCGARRNCLDHPQAEFPPDAAKRWLLRRCDRDDCEFTYNCGIAAYSPAVGQGR